MSLFCRHDYRVKNAIRGENLLGCVTWAVAFYCIKCNKRKLDIGWSEEGAKRQVDWLRSQR